MVKNQGKRKKKVRVQIAKCDMDDMTMTSKNIEETMNKFNEYIYMFNVFNTGAL